MLGRSCFGHTSAERHSQCRLSTRGVMLSYREIFLLALSRCCNGDLKSLESCLNTKESAKGSSEAKTKVLSLLSLLLLLRRKEEERKRKASLWCGSVRAS
jgi:hypothetical protein